VKGQGKLLESSKFFGHRTHMMVARSSLRPSQECYGVVVLLGLVDVSSYQNYTQKDS
jgi:hypothetical protein